MSHCYLEQQQSIRCIKSLVRRATVQDHCRIGLNRPAEGLDFELLESVPGDEDCFGRVGAVFLDLVSGSYLQFIAVQLHVHRVVFDSLEHFDGVGHAPEEQYFVLLDLLVDERVDLQRLLDLDEGDAEVSGKYICTTSKHS